MAAAALVSRRWVHSEPERGNSAENITIMQWNTLADGKIVLLQANYLWL